MKQFPPASIPKPPNPTEADSLVWDSALGKWVAKALNAGSIQTDNIITSVMEFNSGALPSSITLIPLVVTDNDGNIITSE